MTDKISYEFTSQGLEYDEKLSVTDFKGFEGISKPYEFTITLKSISPDIDMNAMLKSNCTFTMKAGNYERPVHGFLSEFEQLHQIGSYDKQKSGQQFTLYKAVLVPRLWQLSLYKTNEV